MGERRRINDRSTISELSLELNQKYPNAKPGHSKKSRFQSVIMHKKELLPMLAQSAKTKSQYYAIE